MKKYAVIALFVANSFLCVAQEPKAASPSTNPLPNKVSSRSEESADFNFKGGTLREFTSAIKDTYGSDLIEIATIPESALDRVRVPKVVEKTTLAGLIRQYNLLSEAGVKWMGKWAPTPYGEKLPSSLIFLPPDDADLSSKLRVFPLTAKQSTNLGNIKEAVEVAILGYHNHSKIRPIGNLHFHEKTKMLIAVGDEQYVTIVSEVVNGFKESSRFLLSPVLPADGNKQSEQQAK